MKRWNELDAAHLRRLWRWGIRDDHELARRLGFSLLFVQQKRREVLNVWYN